MEYKINDLGMREISKKEAEANGIDISSVSICKKIRKLAKLDRFKLNNNENRSKLNKHLFEYIEYCGYEPLEYIKEYLSNLQPYMIERNKGQEKRVLYVL